MSVYFFHYLYSFKLEHKHLTIVLVETMKFKSEKVKYMHNRFTKHIT